MINNKSLKEICINLLVTGKKFLRKKIPPHVSLGYCIKKGLRMEALEWRPWNFNLNFIYYLMKLEPFTIPALFPRKLFKPPGTKELVPLVCGIPMKASAGFLVAAALFKKLGALL